MCIQFVLIFFLDSSSRTNTLQFCKLFLCYSFLAWMHVYVLGWFLLIDFYFSRLFPSQPPTTCFDVPPPVSTTHHPFRPSTSHFNSPPAVLTTHHPFWCTTTHFSHPPAVLTIHKPFQPTVRGRSASSDVSSDISPSPLYIPPHRR